MRRPLGTEEREEQILHELEALQQRLREPVSYDKDELVRLARGLVELVEELRRGRGDG